MRRGKRLLATLGLISTGFSTGLAQDSPTPPAAEPGQQAPAYFTEDSGARRGGLTVQGAPSGSFSGQLPTRFQRDRFSLDQTPAAAAQSPTPASPSAIQQAGFEEPARFDGTPSRRIPAIPVDPSKNVMHAEFQQQPGAGSEIEQIRATAEAENPFLPTPSEPAAPSGNVTETAAENRGQLIELADSQLSGESGPRTPMVTVEWVKKGDINVGQPAECELVVKNSGSVPAADIAIEAHFPSTVRLTRAVPEPSNANAAVTWNFSKLAPGESRTIEITMIPSKRGSLGTMAFVRFTGAASGQFEVQEPLLKLAVDGVGEALIGEPAPQVITVSNPGTGVARNVTIEALIPAGLEHPRGERLSMDIGSLSPGESRRVRLSLVAIAGGPQSLQIRAQADAELEQVTAAQVNVIAPSLKLAVNGPSLRYVGRSGKYDIVITNDGSVASSNVRAKYKVPDGFKFLKADRGGKFDQATRTVDWFVGGLEAGKSSTVSVQLQCEELGAFTHQAIAVSEHGARSVAQLDTRIEGSASLVLEIADQHDPIEIGNETSYEIRVRNEGSKAATNVGISCELSSGVELVSARGPGESISENGLVMFKSLPQLAPGQAAVFTVTVRGKIEGNHRFRARLASDSITEPLIFEELTKFYGE